jgi:AraC-like DNA-binding protein
MSQPRTLPIRVQPIPGEALDSWFTALAHRLHTSLGDLLPVLGLPRRPRTPGSHLHEIPAHWTVLLRPVETASIATATGTEPHFIEAMTLSRYDGTALLIDSTTRRVNRKRLWGRSTGSRFCPDCLAASGGRWQLSWRLGWSFACTVHRRLLADVCPRCERIPHRRPLTGMSQPGRCVEPASEHERGLTPPRCDAELSTAATPIFPAGHPVLAAQQVILDVLEEGEARFGVYAHGPVPTVVALTDLRAVAGRILSYADRGELNRLPADLLAAYDRARSQPAGYRRPVSAALRPGFMAPAHAAIAAVGVTAAVQILASGSIRDAGAALRWLVAASRTRGIAVTPSNLVGWGRDTSVTLKAVQVSAVGPLLKPNDQLRYRISTDTPHHHVPVQRSLSRHCHVPAMFWSAWALRLQPNKNLTLPALRPALSAALLLAGTRHSLPDAAEALDGVPDSHDTSRILQRLQAHHRWPLILTALTRLADYLDEGSVPIDYHRRRRVDYSGLLPEDQWRQICRKTTTAASGRRLRFARCLLFEKISGMPTERAPALFAIGKGDTRTHYLNFAAWLSAEVATHLHGIAQNFLAHHGIHDEPVQWRPPTALLDDLALPGHDPNAVDINALHRLVRESRRSITDAAQRLGTTLEVARHLLDEHPAPLAQDYAANKARAILPKELLTHLYVEQQLSLQEIADRVGLSRRTATRLCDEYGIARRGHGRLFKAAISRDWLHEHYINQRRTLPDLAREVGMSPANLARWAKTHDIPLRPHGGASHADVGIAITQARTAPPVLRPVLTSAHAWDRLHRFAAAAKHPTIRAAAQTLGLHESVLVTQISQLEQALDGHLLTRAHRGRPMQLTPLGRKVIRAVRACWREEMPSN